MAVLIVGAGMVGSQAARQVLDRGETPVLFDVTPNMPHLRTVLDVDAIKIIRGDILEMSELVDAIEANGVDRIIHTAGFLFESVLRRPYVGTKLNIMGTLNVLEAARLTKVQRVVLCSTGFVYHGISSHPADYPNEEDITIRLVSDRPREFYAISKLTSEYLGLSYSEKLGVDFVGVRFGGVFGPWMGPVSGVPGRYIDQYARPGAFGQKIVLSDPFLSRVGGGGSFLYCKDAAKATVLGAFASPEALSSRVYNINMSRMYRMDETLEIVRRVYPTSEIEISPEVQDAIDNRPPTKEPAIAKAVAELGSQPDYELEQALTDYGEWLRRYSSPE